MCHHSDYRCEQHFHHVSHHSGYQQGGCCCSQDCMLRGFPAREEIIKELERYLEQLRAETKGIEERIAELRKED